MEFHGSNEVLGREQVELSERRYTKPIVAVSDETPLFPMGVGGLVPVLTTKASGVETVTYAFAFGEGTVEFPNDANPDSSEATVQEADATDAAGEVAGDEEIAEADEDGEGVQTDWTDEDENEEDPLPPITVASEQEPVLKALLDAVALVNGMLAQAAELSGYPFGQVGAIQIGVGRRGVGFTRVEPTSETGEQRALGVALTLHLETTDENPGAPESFSAVVDYDESGKPVRLAMLEYTDDDYAFRAAANIDEETGKLSIHKVERIDRRIHSERLMYKRGRDAAQVDPECWENRERKDSNARRTWSGKSYSDDGYRGSGYRGGYRDGRGDNRRGGYRDDRWYDDRRYDDRRRDDRRYDRGGYNGRDDRDGYRDRGGRDGYRDRGDRRFDDRRSGYDDRRGGNSGHRDERGYRGENRGGYRDNRGGYRGGRGPAA